MSDRQAPRPSALRAVGRILREALVTGTAVLVPIVVTLLVLDVILGFVYPHLDQVSRGLDAIPGVGSAGSELALDVLAPVVVLVIVVLVGLAVDWTRTGERAADQMDEAFQRVPGIGTIYEGFRDMSEVVVGSDVNNFQEVKLVEFPAEGSYTLGFLTNRTPEPVADAAGESEMQTLFLPIAPNPVMGGFLAHVPKERVRDVDMGVDEGIRTIVTMGVGANGDGAENSLDPDELERLSGTEFVSGRAGGFASDRSEPDAEEEQEAEQQEQEGDEGQEESR